MSIKPFKVPSFSGALLPYCVNKVSMNESESALNAALIGKNHLQGVCNVCLFPVYVAQNVLESASVPYFSNPYCCISQAAQSPV